MFAAVAMAACVKNVIYFYPLPKKHMSREMYALIKDIHDNRVKWHLSCWMCLYVGVCALVGGQGRFIGVEMGLAMQGRQVVLLNKDREL